MGGGPSGSNSSTQGLACMVVASLQPAVDFMEGKLGPPGHGTMDFTFMPGMMIFAASREPGGVEGVVHDEFARALGRVGEEDEEEEEEEEDEEGRGDDDEAFIFAAAALDFGARMCPGVAAQNPEGGEASAHREVVDLCRDVPPPSDEEDAEGGRGSSRRDVELVDLCRDASPPSDEGEQEAAHRVEQNAMPRDRENVLLRDEQEAIRRVEEAARRNEAWVAKRYALLPLSFPRFLSSRLSL